VNTDTSAAGSSGQSLQDHTQCPHWGQGGQYIADPVTGERTRLGALPAAPGAYAKAEAPAPGTATIAADAAAVAPGATAPADVDTPAPDSAGTPAAPASVSHQSRKVKTHGS
jgi:hypothetical protein